MQCKLKIDKLVYGGSGLGRCEAGAAFVPYTLPGEEVETDLERQNGGVLRGRPVAWATRSADRVEPPCPVFTRCGGCHYQHIEYERERALKVEILRETLQRLGDLAWQAPIPVVAAEPWGYRNRTQLRVVQRGTEAEIGFLAPGSHEHVAALECAINSPKLAELHAALGAMVRDRRFPRFVRKVEFFTDERKVQMNLPDATRPLSKRFQAWCAERLAGYRPGALDYQCGEDRFRVSGASFFQVNRLLAAKLARAAVGAAEGGLALDLYCGVGLITLPLARRFREVIAVDSGASAMRDLQHNARQAGLAVRAVQMNVRRFLEACGDRPDCVVADPPRTGLGAAVVRHLARLRAARLHLVSCDPATLARDLKLLGAAGYAIESLTLFDLFPQTYHIETVAILQRR